MKFKQRHKTWVKCDFHHFPSFSYSRSLCWLVSIANAMKTQNILKEATCKMEYLILFNEIRCFGFLFFHFETHVCQLTRLHKFSMLFPLLLDTHVVESSFVDFLDFRPELPLRREGNSWWKNYLSSPHYPHHMNLLCNLCNCSWADNFPRTFPVSFYFVEYEKKSLHAFRWRRLMMVWRWRDLWSRCN